MILSMGVSVSGFQISWVWAWSAQSFNWSWHWSWNNWSWPNYWIEVDQITELKLTKLLNWSWPNYWIEVDQIIELKLTIIQSIEIAPSRNCIRAKDTNDVWRIIVVFWFTFVQILLQYTHVKTYRKFITGQNEREEYNRYQKCCVCKL